MKTTPLHEIPELEDKVPVLAVEGTVKVALDVQHGTTESTGKDWSRQFFVLAQGNDEVGCTLWDAEGNAMEKGEHVRIEATQNKKKQWSGMQKGSYTKDGEKKHTLEIRANSVKIINLDKASEPQREMHDADPYAQHGEVDGRPSDPDWPEAPVNAPESSVQRPVPNLFKEYAGHAGRAFRAAWDESLPIMALIPTKDAEELSAYQWLDLRLRIAQGFAIEINKIIRKERF